MRTVAGSKGRAEANEFVAEVTRCWRPGGRGSQPQPARPPHRPAPHRPRPARVLTSISGTAGWGGVGAVVHTNGLRPLIVLQMRTNTYCRARCGLFCALLHSGKLWASRCGRKSFCYLLSGLYIIYLHNCARFYCVVFLCTIFET